MIPSVKVCTVCGEEKDTTNFYKGHMVCKSCYSQKSKQRYIENCEAVKARVRDYANKMKSRETVELPDGYTKRCSKCGKIKSKDAFHRCGESRDGLFRLCKECKKHMAKVSDDKYYKVHNDYVTGHLNPKSEVGLGVITEYVVQHVLGCNNLNKSQFHSDFDLWSIEYGNINVKSSKLYDSNIWNFTQKMSTKRPDNYVCLGFNTDKTAFEYVWIVPGNSGIITKSGIAISKNNLRRASQYEVDGEPYNLMYQNLNISDLPEFANLSC